MIQNRQLLVPVLPALVLLLAMRASGQTLYYDTSSASQNSNSVQHVTPAGAANTSIFTATGSGGNNVSRCTAIALDTSLQKVFLVDAGNQELWSMNLDGSGLSLVKAGLTNTPTDLALDTVNQMIYYTTSSATVTNNTIQRMDYTGNNNTVLFTAGTSGNNVSRCTALALDLKNSLIFFSDAGVKGIWSLNLSGSGLTLINSNLTAVPLDLALDVTNKFIYYATSSSIQNSNTVQKLNYAGNANTLLFTATGAAGNGVSRCTAIDFDPAGSKLYLADAGTNALWSLNIDGSGLSQVELNLLPTPRRVRFIPAVAPPTTYTWNNPAGGNWNLPGNWSPPTGVPGGSDTAIISDPGSYTVTVSDREAVGTLTMSGASGTQTLNINSGGTLLINKASTGNANAVVNVNGGTLNGIGSLALTGRLNWTGGTISLGVLFGGGGFSSGSLLLNGGMLTNSGVLNWSNNATLDDGNGSVFTNLPGATIIVSNTSSTTWVNGGYYTTGSHVFGNGGTITVGASGTLAMNFENFVNAGTLTVNSGTLSLSGGTQNLANGTLNFGISNLTSFGSVSFSGAADLGGTLTATFNNPTFAPAVNDAWQVMTYGSLVGAFSKTNLPPIVGWQTIAGSKNYTIQIKQLYQPVFVQDLSPTNYALVGAPALLSVQVEGNPPFTNQWYSEAGGITNALNNGDRGGRVTVAATSLNSTNVELSLTISNAQTIDAGPYQVFVTNGYYPYWAASSVGQLVVEPEPLFNVNGSLWTLNGGATIQNNLLTLTDGQPGGETRSAFFNFPMYCQAFRVSFTYQSGLGTTSTRADGVTFCLQNTAIGTGAVGIGGGSLGYKGITNSMAIAIDQFNAKGYEYVTKGQDPATLGQYVQTTPAIDPSGGDPINVSIVYQTNAISLSMTDAVTMGTFVTNFTVGPLPITSATAFVGFTGGSGDLDSVQTISNFTFIPIPPMSAARSGASVLVSWPAGIGGYQLESSTNLGTGDWLTLPGPYNAAGQQYQFLITPTGNAFYRLALP
ncbi:MAG: lectin-like domain-containing protein [Limisphaerales bacterium]